MKLLQNCNVLIFMTNKSELSKNIPTGCSLNEHRPFYATIDSYGGDSNKLPTCKLRCVCIYRKDKQHVMISDHMWIDGKDAEIIMSLTPTDDKPIAMVKFGKTFRPKRGTKIFIVAKCKFYSEGKAKLCNFQRVEPLAFIDDNKQVIYWKDGMPKDCDSALWHGGQ